VPKRGLASKDSKAPGEKKGFVREAPTEGTIDIQRNKVRRSTEAGERVSEKTGRKSPYCAKRDRFFPDVMYY